MKKICWSLLIFALILELSRLSGFCWANEKTPTNELEGCLCRIDHVSKTIYIITARKQEGTDSSVQQSIVYDEKTEFNLGGGVASFKNEATGKETEVQIIDNKVADIDGLMAHYVNVFYLEDKGKRIASEVSLTPSPLLPGSYAAMISSDGPIGFKLTTKCSCSGSPIVAYADLNTDLLGATAKGDLATVQALVAKGAEVNAKDKDGWTALIIAAQNGHTEIVQALLAKGAEVNAKTNDGVTDGVTALYMAAQQGHTETMQALLAKGAKVNAKTNKGATALIVAAQKGHTETVQALLAKGVEVNAKANDGWTALISAAEKGHTETVQALLAKGVEVNAKTNKGGTALIIAAQNGYTEIVQALLAKGAEVNAKTNDGGTALTIAAQNGHTETVNLLKKNKKPAVNELSGCLCQVDQAANIMQVVPLKRDSKGELIGLDSSAPQSFIYESNTKIVGGKEKDLTIGDVKKGKPVSDEIKDLSELAGNKVTVCWDEVKGKCILKQITLVLIFAGESFPAMVGPGAGVIDKIYVRSKCGCDSK